MSEPRTEAGRALVTGEATRQRFHVIDGRRDNLVLRVLAIEAEAAALAAQPESAGLDVDAGIIQRAHVACCWCGEHHEEGA